MSAEEHGDAYPELAPSCSLSAMSYALFCGMISSTMVTGVLQKNWSGRMTSLRRMLLLRVKGWVGLFTKNLILVSALVRLLDDAMVQASEVR